MRRLLLPLLAASAVLSACSQVEGNPSVAHLVGTYDVALSGDRLFIVSSDRDELRVVNTRPVAGQSTDFVRATNPLEPLSIPVLPRPSALTADQQYVAGNESNPTGTLRVKSAGRVLPGPYVYARSSGAATVSIVGTDQKVEADNTVSDVQEPYGLRWLYDLATGNPVTAFAAQVNVDADGKRVPNRPSVLYVATQEGRDAVISRVELPPPSCLLELGRLQRDAQGGSVPEACTEAGWTTLTVTPTVVRREPQAAITSLIVMPKFGTIAYATRAQAGRAGSAWLLDTLGGAQATPTELKFGATVRQLTTHAEVTTEDPNRNPAVVDPVLRPAGQLVYGVLDPSSCGVASECTGVVAVDSTTGQRAVYPGTQEPMLPIQVVDGVPTSLQLVSGGITRDAQPDNPDTKDVNEAGIYERRVELLGIITTTTGQLYLFDGNGLVHLDQDWAPAGVPLLPNTDEQDVALKDAAGNVRTTGPTLGKVEVSDGKAIDEVVSVQWQAELPGLTRFNLRPVAATGPSLVVPADVLTRAEVVKDDVVVPFSVGDNGAFVPCTTDITVTSTDTTTGEVRTSGGEVREQCPNSPYFVVLAAGTRPWVVGGTISGYLGRWGYSQRFEQPGVLRYRPRANATPAATPQLAFTLPSAGQDLNRGDYFVFSVRSNFTPDRMLVRVSSQSFLQLPLAAAFYYGSSAGYVGKLYIADPVLHEVVEVALGLVQPSTSSVPVGVADQANVFF